jgi:hypothetical protein
MKQSSILRATAAFFATFPHDSVQGARGHVQILLLLIALPSNVGAAFAEINPIRGEIIVDRGDAAWESQQVQEPCILPNPKDPSRLIMFYSGVPKTDRAVCAVGKAWTTVDKPFRWHQDAANPVFSPSAKGWDSKTLRLDTVLYIPEEDAYYIYYSGSSGNIQDRIGLAVCPAGSDGYSAVTSQMTQRVGDTPVLAPESAAPFFETMASQAAVWRERDGATHSWKWYMYYSYRGKDGTLPGIRLATSSDGRNWTRHFNVNDPRGMGQLFLSTPEAYYEWHQISKIGHTYVLCIEVGIEHGNRWRPVLAVSDKPDTGWVQLDVDTMLQTKWEGLYRDDRIFHVATPALYQIGGRWFLYAQACALPPNKNYIDGQWDLWCIACDREIETLPGLDRVFIPGAPVSPH